MTQETATPNVPDTANSTTAVPSLDSIAEKMAAMRNQVQATRQTATGSSEEANPDRPVAPNTPEDSETEAQYQPSTEEEVALEAAVPDEQSDETAEPEVSESDKIGRAHV